MYVLPTKQRGGRFRLVLGDAVVTVTNSRFGFSADDTLKAVEAVIKVAARKITVIFLYSTKEDLAECMPCSWQRQVRKAFVWTSRLLLRLLNAEVNMINS